MFALIRGVGLVALALALPAGTARAEEEVRIAIASSRSRITIEGDRLAVFDGERGERIAFSEGRTKLMARADRGGVRIDGMSGSAAGRAARSVLVEADSGVRVDGRLYLGRVAIDLERSKRTLIAINRLPIETYLLGIVGSEMSPAWPIEALKAQAVAARTYALQRRMMMRAANRAYDLEATVLSQVYQGAERIRPSVVEAVSATRGEVLAFHHRLAETLFHSTCGGTTVSAREAFGSAVPYLVPRRCGDCKSSNNYRWKLRLSLDKLEQKLRTSKLLSGKIARVERKAARGAVDLTSGKKLTKISAKALRAAIGYTVILSERFTAETQGRDVVFAGVGFGHGVGMCQWGARGQADRGLDYQEILRHYYSGADVKRIY